MTYKKQSSLSKFTWIIFRDVNRTFGGGLASMELLRRTFITNGSMTDADNAGLVAVSRLTPGTNVLAYCVSLGWALHGGPGALLALVASSLPASIVVCALAVALVRIHEYPAVRIFLAIAVLLATLLVLSSAIALLRPYVRKPALMRAAIVASLAGGMIVAGVTPVRILVLSAIVGAVIGGSTQQAGAAE